jgi:hypothetical protein
MAGTSTTVKMIAAYQDLVYIPDRTTWAALSLQEFALDFYRYPLVPYEIESYIVRVIALVNTVFKTPYPSGFTSANTEIEASITAELIDIPAMNYDGLQVQWIDEATSARLLTELDRQIEIDPWGFIKVTEQHKLYNIGTLVINQASPIVVMIPPHSVNITAYDETGQLTVNLLRLNESQRGALIVSPRFSLPGGANLTYWINYRLPLGKFQNSLGLSAELDFKLFNQDRIMILNQKVTFILPGDTLIHNLNTEPSQVSFDSGIISVTFENYNVTPLDTKQIQIQYTPNYLTLSVRPLLFALLIGLVASIYVASRRILVKEKPIIIQMEQVPKSLLRQYSEMYDEKIALILQVEQLEESRRRKKVPVREYVQRRRRFESQLNDLFKQINETSQDIKNISGRFADIVKRLEILEAERDGARAAAARLRRRYRNRRITREVYDRLRVEEERKVNRTTSRIDGLIFELRQAAEE